MLKTSIERLEGSSVKLTVTVPSDQVDEAIKKAYADVGAKVRIPGFRKGKAPRSVVDNYMGHDHVLAEATEALVESTYPAAVDQEGLRTIEAPEMEGIATVEPGEEYTYVAEVELRPELTLSSIDGISVAVPSKEVTDAQIDQEIEVARDRFASLEPVEGRGIEANDFALISFVGDVDGEPFEGNQVDKYMYELGRGQMPAKFDEGLLGIKAGDTGRIEFEIPETSSTPDFVGKTAGFDVTVHEIKAKVLPDVDDEFAVSVGGFDSVAQMREDMSTRLARQLEMQHERAKEMRVKEALAERLEGGDVPEALVRQRTAQLMRDFTSALKERDMTVAAYCNSLGLSLSALEADFNQQGEKQVREDLALEALFREKEMEVTDAEVRAEIGSMVANEEDIDDMVKSWEDAGLMAVVHDEIMHRKAVQWLLENAEIEIVDPNVAADATTDSATTDSTKTEPSADAAENIEE